MKTEQQIARNVRRFAAHLTIVQQDAIIAKRVAASRHENARATEPRQPIMPRRVTATRIIAG